MIRTLTVIASLALTLPSLAVAQGSAAPGKEAVLTAARDVIQKARFVTFITIGEDGQPQARIVDPFAPDSAFVIWIGTNPLTRKVAQVRHDPRVTLQYFDPVGFGEVTVIGRAEIVGDSAAKSAHWKPEWGGIYKGGSSSPDYVLVRVVPKHLEIVSPKQGMNSDPKTWRPVSVDLL